MPGKLRKPENKTLLEAVHESLLRAVRYDPGTMVAPAVILWTDADGQWLPLVSQLRPLMPELLTLGSYNPGEKIGPAIWLRCVIERMQLDFELPESMIPVIYMPDVSRQMLRAGGECKDNLKPLVELQYRGTVWTQRNGKDWTIEAFLVSEDGLGLDVAKDKDTRLAMRGSLPELAGTSISQLQGKRLEAEDFDRLMVADTSRDLLLWMSNPVQTRESWGIDKWFAFCSRCKAEYGFDPESDGELVAAEKLGMRETDIWRALWVRCAEAPALYAGIPNLLRRAKPSRIIFDREPWPDENEKEENYLRQGLLKLDGSAPTEARQKIEELENRHGERRAWIWSKLGQTPLADALEHLTTLARKTAQGLGGDSPKAMAELYTGSGYLADDAALQAISCVKSIEDVNAVEVAIRSMYFPWLEDTARHFQDLVTAVALPSNTSKDQSLIVAEPGQCLLFIDGLRFDISQRLVAMAEERQLEVTTNWRWAGLPTVTATAKPAVSPMTEDLSGDILGDDFLPQITKNNLSLTTDRFRKLLVEAGYQVFNSYDTGNPNDPEARGWTEYGEFDSLGHKLQAKLAVSIDDQLELVMDRIQTLLNAGWKQVRVVTDHGWLLLPGGLPAMKLPKYLTECRWTRCATLKQGAYVDVPTVRWHWNVYQQFAFALGAYCFIRGNEYAHGGISLQECIIPEIAFVSNANYVPTASISNIQWFGMRCRVTITPISSEVRADLRTKPNDVNTSIIITPKQFDTEGCAGLIVADDSYEGTVVSLVLLDPSGRVFAKQATTVGGED